MKTIDFKTKLARLGFITNMFKYSLLSLSKKCDVCL